MHAGGGGRGGRTRARTMTVISNENQAPAMGNVPVHGLTLRGRQHNLKRTSNVCFSRHAICY